MIKDQSLFRNTLLRSLAPEDFEFLRNDLKAVAFAYEDKLTEPGGVSGCAYFLETGVASIVVRAAQSRPVEVAIVGFEGMVGIPVVLGVERTPHECLVQLPGSGYRVAAATLRAAMARRPGIRDHLLRYVQWLMIQCADTAASNAVHTIEQRLARWLLMCQDRIEGEVVPLTHELMSALLGVRRAGVTVALHRLEGDKTIRASRGRIAILDRAKLQLAARGSYGRAEAAYREIIGVRPPILLEAISTSAIAPAAELYPA